MIIKKPYAFLIKRFRVIHAILFGLLLFILAKSFNIYTFFSNYVQTHSYVNITNLSDTYVSALLFLAIILSIVVTFIIYYILSLKQKSNKTYLLVFMYYLLMLIYFIYMHVVFSGLEEKSLDVESVRAFRDIGILVILPQLGFIVIILGRMLGFNLKQFDFKKDLEELEIDVSDNEEVEVTLGNDTYKIARFFRKLLRLTKYFILENKLFVIGITSILVFVISIYTFNKLNVYKESYDENQNVSAIALNFKVNNSYITSRDINNVIIKDNKYFVLVDVFISNKLNSKRKIERDTFRLKVGSELLLPSFNYSNSFIDIGDVFSPFELNAGTDINKLVVFQIDKKDLKTQLIFKINNLKYSSNEQYKDILIYPKDLNESENEGMVYTLPNQVKFTDSLLKNSSINIKSFEFAEKFKEEYTYYLDGQTKKGLYSILPTSTNKKELAVLKIEATLKMDKDVYAYKRIKTPADFFTQYGLIKYRYQGNYKTVKLNKINNNFKNDDYSFLEVDKEVLKANKIQLIILIRGVKYIFNLK